MPRCPVTSLCIYWEQKIFSYITCIINVIVKLKKNLTLIYYYYAIYDPYSNFINCPNDVLYSYFFPQSKL